MQSTSEDGLELGIREICRIGFIVAFSLIT